MNTLFEAHDLQKVYASRIALNLPFFRMERGEVVALTGYNGCGKSTLLRCCTLLERADAGRIAYDDLVMADTGADGKAEYSPSPVLQQIRRRFGLVFQNFNLFPHFSVLRNLTEAPVRVLGDGHCGSFSERVRSLQSAKSARRFAPSLASSSPIRR